MIAIRTFALTAFLTAGLTGFVHAPPASPVVPRHTRLIKSDPASDDTLAKSPAAIRLWFSEQVELPVTTVRLADASGTTIALAPLTRPDTGQSAPVTAVLKAPLKGGGYVIRWSTAAKDGHAESGTFNFVVKAAR